MADNWRQCTPRCRSKNHASWLMSALTKSSSEIENILCLTRCFNAGLVSDELGHTVLHIAAAYGRKKVLDWLSANFRVNVNAKDLSSGWTPLHFAVYHGHIDAMVSLILSGADLYMKDFNCQTPLDILKSDLRLHTMLSDEADVFTWGQNSSYTLGLANGQSKSIPETLPLWSCDNGNADQQRRMLSVVDVVMTKYTSFYLTGNGKVFACGSGRGGRLGLGSEQTVLAPTQLQFAGKQVVAMSANVNHAAFVTSEGQLFVTGLNDHQQLGLGPSCAKELSPKLVRFKKDTRLKFVVCGRFHTAVISDRELFTCGLNAGQLGLLKDLPFQSDFKFVTAVAANARDSQNSSFLSLLACSDSATVVKTCAGDVLALTSYGCKKIASNCPGISHIAVSGGRLDHTAAPEILKAEKGVDLTILMLIGDAGQVLVWRECSQSNQGGLLRELRCAGLGRDLFASWIWAPMAATDGRVLMCTNDGNAYVVTLSPSSQAVGAKDNKSKSSKTEWSAFHVADKGRTSGMFRAYSYELASSTVRIKHIHRALRIVADPGLANFACIQLRPETSIAELPVANNQTSSDFVTDLSKLFEMTSSMYDSGTDVELVFGSNICLYAHRTVLASMSSYFRRLFISSATSGSGSSSKRLRVNISDCEESEFKPLLKFAYTCQVDLKNYLVADESNKTSSGSNSARVSPNSQNSSGSGKKKKTSPKGKQQQQQQQTQQNSSNLSEASVVNAQLLGRLAELAKRFGMGGGTLSNELESLRVAASSGRAYSTSFRSSAKLSIEREALEDFADVWLRSTDGREFSAHRCILSCRSDYFGSMLAVGRWAEAGRAVITQPIDGDVLELALTYIYSDWLGDVTDWKLLCKLVVYADQIFLNGLKSVAEVQLSMSPRLNLQNVCQLIDFAYAYRADVLLPAATRFAIANLPCLLETHFASLSSIEDEALAEVSESYIRLVCPTQRAVKPWSSMAPSCEEIAEIVTEAKKCKILTDDDLEVLVQNIGEMLIDSKEQNQSGNQGGNGGARVQAVGRHRRVRRRSGTSESSDGGSTGSGHGMAPISINTSHPPSPLHMGPPSPSLPLKNSGGPMSPSLTSRFNPITANSLNDPSILAAKRSNGWSENSGGGNKGKSDGVSLADIMANEKRQQENDNRGVRIKSSRPRNLVQLPALSCGVASSPPTTGNYLQVLATSPSNVRPGPMSPSGGFKGWGCVASSPVASPVPILADILRQEQQRTENTRRQDRRSLHQIQLEERAIDELTKLYADLEVHGIAVTVERLSSAVGVSAPMWAARTDPKIQNNGNSSNGLINHFPALSATATVGYSSHR